MITREFFVSEGWYEELSKLFAAPPPAVLSTLAELLTRVFRAEEFMLLKFEPDTQPELLLQRTDRQDRKQQLSEYLRGYYLLDPIYLNIEKVSERSAASLSELQSIDELHLSEYYRHHYQETLFCDEFCYCVKASPSAYLLVSLARANSVGAFTAEETSCAKAIAPLVGRVIMDMAARHAESVAERPDQELHFALKDARNNFARTLLTQREFEVLQYMLRGNPIDRIGDILDMAQGTAKVHRRNIYRKLDINSQVELFSLFFDAVSLKSPTRGSDPLEHYLSGARVTKWSEMV